MIFEVQDNTEKTQELDQVFSVTTSDDIKYAVGLDTFLNQDLISQSTKKPKVGIWLYAANKVTSGDSVFIDFKHRTFVPFDTLKGLTGNKMNTNFRLLSVSWSLMNINGTLTYMPLLLGYIPATITEVTKIALYELAFTQNSTSNLFENFTIRQFKEHVVEADFGTEVVSFISITRVNSGYDVVYSSIKRVRIMTVSTDVFDKV
jgi:hypothetical protein